MMTVSNRPVLASVVFAAFVFASLTSAAPPTTTATSPTTGPTTGPATAPTTQQTPEANDKRAFTVTPAAIDAGRSYRFDFPREEQYDGNGVAAFLQAMLVVPNEAVMDQLFEIDSTDSDAEYARKVDAAFPGFGGGVGELTAVAVRYHEFDFPLPTRDIGIGTLLPYLNHARNLQNMVHYHARLAAAAGDFRQAVEGIRAMAVLAHHVDGGSDVFLVNNLVAVGMGQMCLDEIHRLIAKPGAPNLYWPLRRLPRPFGNFVGAMRGEESPFELTFPVLREARNGRELSAAEWRDVTATTTKFMARSLPETRPATDPGNDLAAGHFTAERLAAARRDYARRYRHSADEVANLPPEQVVAAYYYHTYRDVVDAILKPAALPYPQAIPALKPLIDRTKRLQATQSDNPFIATGQIDPGRAMIANARLDRAIAATATIEAVRAYAATHGGHAPAALADLVDTPAPDNPATGRPFDYSTADNVSVISDPGEWLGRPLRYEVKFRR